MPHTTTTVSVNFNRGARDARARTGDDWSPAAREAAARARKLHQEAAAHHEQAAAKHRTVAAETDRNKHQQAANSATTNFYGGSSNNAFGATRRAEEADKDAAVKGRLSSMSEQGEATGSPGVHSTSEHVDKQRKAQSAAIHAYHHAQVSSGAKTEKGSTKKGAAQQHSLKAAEHHETAARLHHEMAAAIKD